MVVRLQVRSMEGEVSSPLVRVATASSKGKEKVGESAAAPESHVGEVYRRREILPFRHDTLLPTWGIRV